MKINMLFAGLVRSVLGKPVLEILCMVGHTEDLGHSFFQYRPPGQQITYCIFILVVNKDQTTWAAVCEQSIFWDYNLENPSRRYGWEIHLLYCFLLDFLQTCSLTELVAWIVNV